MYENAREKTEVMSISPRPENSLVANFLQCRRISKFISFGVQKQNWKDARRAMEGFQSNNTIIKGP